MTIDDKTKDERLKNNDNREVVKISTLPSGTTAKHHTDEKYYISIKVQRQNNPRLLDLLLETYLKNKRKQLQIEVENKQTLKSLNFANKTKDLKRVKYIFSHRQLANLIKDKLKRNIELQKSTQINY